MLRLRRKHWQNLVAVIGEWVPGAVAGDSAWQREHVRQLVRLQKQRTFPRAAERLAICRIAETGLGDTTRQQRWANSCTTLRGNSATPASRKRPRGGKQKLDCFFEAT